MTTTNLKKIQAGYEPIAGYRLEQMIGRGGFGEVWRADAPGGLKKAVKFVFGDMEQHRATRELRSLERIKGVHHPFLLTLERFEIVDDQLVIITELADGSLEDVFNRHRERGSCGIPRAAMLAYMHDAADALDYLHQSYQLQHLDIKPGNLLLVGGHVKVADFGLLKDLRDDDCSVIGGLTPIYAPPEVFDGRPSMHSDQYSLAVMYQELLTGSRPFNGRTIAQLATQHVSSSPDLESLPPSDRPVVARALEKSPERRFASCKEFVETLRKPRGRTSVSGFGDCEIGGDTLARNTLVSNGNSEAVVQDLPQLKTDPSNYLIRVTGHALVVALGGIGADCLQSLRGRVSKLSAASPLDLHSIMIDTDAESIYAASLSEASGIVPPCQAIHTPLRGATEYRTESADRLATISRRWIYNIPRSRTTEGMRPLGRLALVDHAAQVLETLRESTSHLAAVCGDRTPHVYVVGSISGGTASGMFIDVAHVLRHLLDEAGLEHAVVMPILSMQSLRPDSNRPLAIHDSCAALVEMRHLMQPGNGYPGDAGAKLPSLPAARSPMRGAYVVASPPQQTIAGTVENIVDYIWADTTGAGALLAASRRTDGDEQSTKLGSGSLRSFGVVRLGGVRALEENLLAPATVRALFLRWMGRPAEAKQIATPLAERLLRRCSLDSDSVCELSCRAFGEDAKSRSLYLRRELAQMPVESRDNEPLVRAHLKARLEECNGDAGADPFVASTLVALQRELLVRLQDRRVDVISAIEALHLLIQRTASDAAQLVSADTPQSLSSDPGEAILQQVAIQQAAKRLSEISRQLVGFLKRFEDLATLLAQGIQKLNQDESLKVNPWDRMPAEIASRFEQTMGHLHQQVAESYLMRYVVVDAQEIDADELVRRISEATVKIVKVTLESNSIATETATATTATNNMAETATLVRGSTTLGAGKAKPQSTIESALAAVRPHLLACGGRQRLILVVGTDAERTQLESELRGVHNGSLTVAVIPGMTPMLIHEAQQIKIDDVITRLSMMAAGSHQITQRLHTRNDIEWN